MTSALRRRHGGPCSSRRSPRRAAKPECPVWTPRIFASGKRSYLVQYRAGGQTRRFTIGAHGVWAPEAARKEARILLGRIAQGENPAEQKQLDTKAVTIKELCTRYLADCEAGLVPGKGGRPKKPSTLNIDRSRIKRHILPLLGNAGSRI